MNQPALNFDAPTGQERRDRGLEKVERHYSPFLRIARRFARELAERNGKVTADDVRAECARIGVEPEHPNAWGAVFRTREWEATGEFRRSETPSAHARMVRVWRIRRGVG